MFAKRNVLLAALIFLLCLRFFVLPVLDWQAHKVANLQSKSLQLAKVQSVISNQSAYESRLGHLKAAVIAAEKYLYTDSSDTKLDIQKDIYGIFESNDLSIKTFTWGPDSEQAVRKMSATVAFSGPQAGMLLSLWDLSSQEKLFRIQAWRQQFKSLGDTGLGFTTGSLTLEIYAGSKDANKVPADLALFDNSGDI